MIITAILPMLAVIVIGVFLQRSKLLGEQGVTVISTLLTKIFFSIFLFQVIAKQKISTIMNWPFIGSFVATIVVTYVLTVVLYAIFSKDKTEINILRGFSAACPNNAYIGIPLLLAVFGRPGLTPDAITTIISVLMMPLVLIFLQKNVAQKHSFFSVIVQLGKHVIQTPINIGIILGLLYSFLHLPYPKMLNDFTTIMGESSIPCALLSVGMVLAKQKITHIKEVSLVSLIKLIVMPVLAIVFAKLFKLDTTLAIALVLSCALPTAVMDYMVAEELHVFVRRASSIILLTTALSVIGVTVFHQIALAVF